MKGYEKSQVDILLSMGKEFLAKNIKKRSQIHE